MAFLLPVPAKATSRKWTHAICLITGGERLADRLSIPFTENDSERLKGVSRMDSLEIIPEIGKVRLSGEMKRGYAQLKNEWYVGYIGRMTPDVFKK